MTPARSLEATPISKLASKLASTTDTSSPPSESAGARAAAKEKERERRRLEKRVQMLEGDVAKLEAELGEVRAALTSDHGGDWQKLHTLADREQKLDDLLTRRMTEWETASAALTQDG
jgi:hypothetical protein